MTLLRATGTVALERGELALDLTVHRGEIVGLVGPNGAGKTATLLTVLGLRHLRSGRIEVGDDVVDDARRRRPPHRRGLGWAPQAPALLPRRRAARQVAVFLRDDAPLADHGVDGLLEDLALTDLAHQRPAGLSGGEAQRVAVARALVAGRLALLDEPTSAQDADGAHRIRRLVRAHTIEGGGAVVVAHRPEDAYAFADRIVVLQDGAVVQAGAPTELASRPATPYVAHVVGATVLHGTGDGAGVVRGPWGELAVADDVPAGPATVVVRPGAVVLHRQRPAGSSRNVVPGVVASLNDSAAGVSVRVDGRPSLAATLTHAAAAKLDLRVGDEVWASVKANDVTVTATGHGG